VALLHSSAVSVLGHWRLLEITGNHWEYWHKHQHHPPSSRKYAHKECELHSSAVSVSCHVSSHDTTGVWIWQ